MARRFRFPALLSHAFPWILKLLLAVMGVVLVAWRRRGAARRPSRWYWGVLAVTAAVGLYSYHSQPSLGYVGSWDIYHHYLGAKYSRELGYDKLYGATIAADDEGAKMFAGFDRVREIRTQGFVTPSELLARRDYFKGDFTPDRWAAFCRDVAWFQPRMTRAIWVQVLTDRGYHPTPAWDRLAGLMANRVPLESAGAVYALTLPDEVLWLVACVAVARAYGLVTLGLFVVAWGANPLHMTPLKGAFLRLDWLAAMLVSMAAYRRKRHALSGACLGWAALTRVFPVVFVGGVLARAAWTVIETRRLDRRDLRFFAGFVGVATALFVVGCPVSRWQAFAQAIRVHADVVSWQRSGLEYLVGLGRPQLYWPCALLLAGFTAFAARRMTRARLLPAGLALMFTFIAAASYYYVVVSVLVLCFHRRGSASDTWGLGVLMSAFGLGAATVLVRGSPLGGEISYLWSMMLLGLSLYVIWPRPRAA